MITAAIILIVAGLLLGHYTRARRYNRKVSAIRRLGLSIRESERIARH